MSTHSKIAKALGVVIAVSFVAALVVGARTFGQGNLTRARQIAVRLQADAIANPNPVASPAATTDRGGSAAAAIAAATAAPPSGSTAPSGGAAGSTKSSPKKVAAVAKSNSPAAPAGSSSTPSTSGTKGKTAAPALGPAAAVSTKAPRRQPTAAEVALAITAVNNLIPFFTPTPDQIASSGDQVCTALDQGQPFSQVESQALDMVGAGSISWMIPSSAPEIAIRTLVALYCPGNASKLP